MKLVLGLALLLITIQSYEMEDSVIVLHDSDFPTILTDFPTILIQFYAPWCGHCKTLAPVYSLAAHELSSKGSQIRLAKVDATVEKEAAQKYDIKGFPTLLYFIDGKPINYKGARNKQAIISWVQKKLEPAIRDLGSQETYQRLSSSSTPSVVLFSSDVQYLEYFNSLAVADEDNVYYMATGDILSSKTEGTVELHRNFDQTVVFNGDKEGLPLWIKKYSSLPVAPFDQKTVSQIFGDGTPALVLFNSDSDATLTGELVRFSKQYTGRLVFTELTKTNEHYGRFSEYLHVSADSTSKLLVVHGKQQKKYLYHGSAHLASYDSISEFVRLYEHNQIPEFKLNDSVDETAFVGDEQL